ncbi:MAG: hypothetical protein M1827_002584 [Pycnora praestabilis]|nr:MAG: hypothetical protein M1827_002584 [Pycnora praestabilis]
MTSRITHNPLDPEFRFKSAWVIDDSTVVVPEDTLLQISRDLRGIKLSVASDDLVKWHLLRLASALMRTVASAKISSSHRAAASNAICGFLEQCLISPIDQLKDFCYSASVWSDLLTVYLERSEHAKGKSMRQLLATLASIITRNPNRPAATSIRDKAVERLLGIVFHQEPHSRAKAALHGLEYIVSNDVLETTELMSLFQVWSKGNALPSFSGFGLTDVTNISMEVVAWTTSVEWLTKGILDWIGQPDVAPAAGHVVSALFLKLRRQQSRSYGYYNFLTKLPLWVAPLVNSVHKFPDALDNFKHQVFPGLFKLDLHDYILFIESLGLETMLSDDFQIVGSPATIFLLCALEVGKSMNLVEESDDQGYNHVPSNSAAAAIVLPNALLERLLLQSSTAIRIAALSLLITSVSTTRRFTRQVLSLLRRNMAYLHSDTDANFRSEFLSSTRRLIDRLRGAMSSSSKDLQRLRRFNGNTEPRSRFHRDLVLDHFDPVEASEKVFLDHVEFVNWYMGFLILELEPTAPYQRHITGLKAIYIVFKSGILKEFEGLIETKKHYQLLGRPLLDLLMDPFDDVRNSAAVLINMLPLPVPQAVDGSSENTSGQQMLLIFLGRAQHIAQRTGRADHADGLARSYEILYENLATKNFPFSTVSTSVGTARHSIVESLVSALEDNLTLVRKDLASAVAMNPVHGQIASIRYIFDRPDFYPCLIALTTAELILWKALHERVIECCRTVWYCVREILCDDSPEGFLFDDSEHEVDVGTKDVLSYSWRALKEASALLRTIVSKATHDIQTETSILKDMDFRTIGQLTFVQLAELRHRGAFSTVSMTFSACCERCMRHTEVEISQLPLEWYRDTLSCIRDKASTVTRRSAGIPSLITGILAANQTAGLLNRVIADLYAEARVPVCEEPADKEAIKLPQVHALNCLKAIFTSTKLGPSSEPYVADALELAVGFFDSTVWSIRNCGMMLFRALMDRIFGTNQIFAAEDSSSGKKASKFSPDRYPTLNGLIATMLERSDPATFAPCPDGRMSVDRSSALVEAIFPALEIAQRVGLVGENSQIRPLILRQLANENWLVRTMAARTASSMIPVKGVKDEMAQLFDEELLPHNLLHGRLLYIKYMFRRYFTPQERHHPFDEVESLMSLLERWYHNIFLSDECPFTKAAFLDVVYEVSEKLWMGGYFKSTATAECLVQTLLRRLSRQSSTGADHHGVLGGSNSFLTSASLGISYASIDCLHTALRLSRPAMEHHLESISRQDQDTACEILHRMERYEFGQQHDQCLVASYVVVLQTSLSPKVKAIAATNLAEALEDSPALASICFPLPNSNIASTLEGIQSPNIENPALANAYLHLYGLLLASQINQGATSVQTLGPKLRNWSHLLHYSSNKRKDFDTRYAAAASLAGLKNVFLGNTKVDDELQEIFLGIYLVLYDLLNDDDDEIRLLTARTVSCINLAPEDTGCIVPLAASSCLSKFLSSHYPDSTKLWLGSLLRFIGSNKDLASTLDPDNGTLIGAFRPVCEILREISKENTTLFAEEKQNLFIHEVGETEIWCQILLQLSSTAIARDVRVHIEIWVMEGILALKEKAEGEMDGPLGWTSKPETFALGMRVICMAEVVLYWANLGTSRGHFSGAKLCQALEEFVGVGQQHALHGIWLQRVNSVLKKTASEAQEALEEG